MKKWSLKKLLIIVVDILIATSLLLQIQATAVLYHIAITKEWTLPLEPLRRYYGYGLHGALLTSSNLIELYQECNWNKDIYYNMM